MQVEGGALSAEKGGGREGESCRIGERQSLLKSECKPSSCFSQLVAWLLELQSPAAVFLATEAVPKPSNPPHPSLFLALPPCLQLVRGL